MLDGAPSLTRLIISENDAYPGGGLYVCDSEAMLEDVVIDDNRGGGGLYATNSAISLVNVAIRGNESDRAGGACFLTSVAELTNVLVTDNSTVFGGVGGVLLRDSSATLTNVEVSANHDRVSGIAVYDSSVTLTNVLVTNNTTYNPTDGNAGVYSSDSTLTFSHSDIYGNTPNNFYNTPDPTGTDGNISVDPDLYDDAVHLNTTSPLIDAGDPTILDPDGSPSDIGAFGGPGADDWDLDLDGYPSWWLPGTYDPATSPGMDCDDGDAAVYPGAGC